ncbi:retrovirus-related pol polyprotein from transposon TNT 1-94 [Tanacetum coccineum]
MSRTMLNEQSLPQKFWCNAVYTSTYILNRILIRAILGKTPYELLRGRKPTLDYFRVFGSKCFILNTKDYLTKFDPKSCEGVFRKLLHPLRHSLGDDTLYEEEAIKVTKKKNLENDIVDETLEIDEIVNIKESRNHPVENDTGNLNQITLRLFAQGYNQQEGIDYDETYAPVAKLESIRILLAYACDLDFKLFQIDVKSAFLNGLINEEVSAFGAPLPRAPKTVTDLEAFECLLEINEQVCPRFILEFYSQYCLSYSDEGQMFVEFVIQNQYFSLSLEDFAQILRIPCEGACVFSDRWSLDELVYGAPSEGPYQTNLPSPDDIISYVREDREGQVTRIHHQEEVMVQHYQILTREIVSTLKPLEEIIWEDIFCLGVIGTTFQHVFVICFIVLQTPKDSILPISWKNEWSGLLNKVG